MQFQIKTWH